MITKSDDVARQVRKSERTPRQSANASLSQASKALDMTGTRFTTSMLDKYVSSSPLDRRVTHPIGGGVEACNATPIPDAGRAGHNQKGNARGLVQAGLPVRLYRVPTGESLPRVKRTYGRCLAFALQNRLNRRQ